MKHKSILAFSLAPLLLVSCFNQGGGEDYDVSNPYAAPEYPDNTAIPSLPSDVNPAYEEVPVYEDTTPAIPQPAYTPPVAQARVHTVVPGDSLWKISKKYGVSVDSIKQANAMTRDIVVLGTKLKIPAQ